MDDHLAIGQQSPGFTPVHHPDMDQQIFDHAIQQQQNQAAGMQLTPYGGLSTGTGMQQTPIKTHTYAPSFSTPQQLMQPQTPQSLMSPMVPMQDATPVASVKTAQQDPASNMNIHSTIPGTPMTPMTPADSGIVPQLQNIVSTVNLGCKLDLKKIALQARNAEYNPKRFAAVIMRIREPRTTALIFSSGKMVCTGAKSEEDSRLAARKYARIIQKLGFTAKFVDFKIQNMVGSCDVKFPIRLEGLVFQHAKFSSYEPELFPGLIYRMVKPRIVLLIFVSGKVVLTGAKVRREIYDAFDNIYPILKSFKKQ